MPKIAHVRTQDQRRIHIARNRSKRLFDLRDLRLVGSKEALWAVQARLPPDVKVDYFTWEQRVLPLMERAGHAVLIRRVSRQPDLIGEMIEFTTSRHATWIVQVDALPMWILYIVLRKRKIVRGEWHRLRKWSLDDFLTLAYCSTDEEVQDLLLPNVWKGE